jgi:hypothetical protein
MIKQIKKSLILFPMAVLEVKSYFGTLLICAEGTKTPAGGRDRGDPAGALASRRLPEPPAESEVPGAQINRYV